MSRNGKVNTARPIRQMPVQNRFFLVRPTGPMGDKGVAQVADESRTCGHRPKFLRSARLMVNAGRSKYPKVIPIVVDAATDALAMGKALRVGRRMFGADFIGAVTGRSLRLNCQRRAAA
jgi:hypothetical protein